ncbi:MAG: hypothetical protein KDB14_16505 [Planctomycetales bacterium]|nr:hypothetical protein [Planctomycetales bacterium]
MASSHDRSLQWLCLLPAGLLTVAFEIWLGHRHDYAGHFAAGYGASLSALAFFLKQHTRRRAGTWWLLPVACVLLIAAGAIAELTIFRLAKFDEVDFFNQSLGAVLACVVAVPLLGRGDGLSVGGERRDGSACANIATISRPADLEFDAALIAGLVLLVLGGSRAFA